MFSCRAELPRANPLNFKLVNKSYYKSSFELNPYLKAQLQATRNLQMLYLDYTNYCHHSICKFVFFF